MADPQNGVLLGYKPKGGTHLPLGLSNPTSHFDLGVKSKATDSHVLAAYSQRAHQELTRSRSVRLSSSKSCRRPCDRCERCTKMRSGMTDLGFCSGNPPNRLIPPTSGMVIAWLLGNIGHLFASCGLVVEIPTELSLVFLP